MTQVQTQNGGSWRARLLPAASLAAIFAAIVLMHPAALAAQDGTRPGTIKGQVLVVDSTGSSYVPGTMLVLNGPESLKAESNTNGALSFPSVAPGTYVIQANAPGPEGEMSVSVDAG